MTEADDSIRPGTRGLVLLRVLLKICAIEFFGPWVRDFSDSHVFHPTWVPRASAARS